MTIKETTKIIMVLSTMFPNFKMEKPQETVEVWNWALEEYSYEQVNIAIKEYMKNSDGAFAPSVAQLIHLMEKPNQVALDNSYIDEAEAWSMVMKAVRNSGYHSAEEFDKLPTLIQRAIGSASELKSWALDEDFNESVQNSHFNRRYNELIRKDKEIQKMPEEYKAIMQRKEQALIG